ncbi:MAG: CoA transferase [Clostridia bacterium]|nr:CoA transferase [Deltaproteobacteria bacterium]
MSGPLKHLHVVEMAAIGPTPFAGMMLADMGADVVRIDKPTGTRGLTSELGAELFNRGKRSIVIDLKTTEGKAVALELIAKADILIEGHRPGVMERLGLGPDVCLARNRKLAYGRMTGYGQTGPLSDRAGHDINYIALAGALGCIGNDKPVIPVNFVGDFGGGGMALVVGVLAAAMSAKATGQGQVVDASMIEGTALLMTMVFGMRKDGLWNAPRGQNLLDGGAAMYDSYRTKDGQWMSVGPLERQFFVAMMQKLELPHEGVNHFDPQTWAPMRVQLEQTFASKTRAEWESVFADSDACVHPVLSLDEVASHPQNKARSSFVDAFGALQPAPAPCFSATPSSIRSAPPHRGEHTRAILEELGVAADVLIASGVVEAR